MTRDTFNYVAGTQTFGPTYRFTKDDALLETAGAIRHMGSNTLKFILDDTYLGMPRGGGRTPLERLQRNPSLAKVLGMPFAHYLVWVYTSAGVSFLDGLSDRDEATEYSEYRALAEHLLKRYSGSGKTFYLGHWEGDWHLHRDYNPARDPGPAALKGMARWLRARQRAVDDARATTSHHGVQVYNYAEVNLVRKAMKGGRTLTNDVLPEAPVDFVSYSSYDSLDAEGGKMREQLRAALTYIEAKLAPKPHISGRRVFIGEYGTPLEGATQESQAERSRHGILAALEWECPFALYWEMYNNEVSEGRQRGFWCIDDRNRKQMAYHLHHDYLRIMREWVARNSTDGTPPSRTRFYTEARRAILQASVLPPAAGL